MKRLWYIFLLIIVVFSSCRDNVQEECVYAPNVESISIDLPFESLESKLPAITTKQELVDFFASHIAMRDYFFNREAYPSDSAFINELYYRFTNPHLDTLLMETQKVFGDGSQLKQELTVAFSNLTYYYPDFKLPKVQTVISGLENDMFMSDSVIVISLDYYLGKGARYRPNMYEYMLRRYEKDFILPSLMLLYGIDSRFNETDLSDRTVLADMVAYGKAYYFAKRMLPCTADSVLIGYTSEEITGARTNQDMIWKKLVEDEAFYSTSQQLKQRYIAERPHTFELGEKAPGRIGTWVGWQIVNKYAAQNSDLTLPQIMKVKDAKKIFTESKYKPVD
ncbi:MAG: gliding motility lipoprotein GldB [Cyclobacteriaceae bacterium]|nr:gliding motility lipoprotein GldB [Cyclobacteriaceae bacterium]